MGVTRDDIWCKKHQSARSLCDCPKPTEPSMPPVNKPVLVCVNDGENVFFMVAQRTHKDIWQSFVYYSPEHGEEFELQNVVEWHPLP